MRMSLLGRVYKGFSKNIVNPPKLSVLLLVVFALFLPLTQPGEFLLGTLTLTFVLAVFAASWDLLAGYCGQVTFGHALFFGLACYGTALLYKFHKFSPWISVPMNILFVSVIALLAGFPCLRVKGPYLALVSLTLPQIATMLILLFRDVTHGDRGLKAPPFFPFLSITQQTVSEYYLALVVLVVSGIIMYKIVNATTGKIFISILDNELGSQACGINVTKYKLMAFVISGCFASLAGSLWAPIGAHAGLYTLSLSLSFYPIIWTIFGGIQTIYGAIMGTVILEMLSRYVLTVIIRFPEEWRLIIYVTVIMIFILKFRMGAVRLIAEILKGFKRSEEKKPHV